MKKSERYAIAWAILMLVFMGIAALNLWEHQMEAGIVILVGGWAMCVIHVFDCGASYAFDLVIELLDAFEEKDSDIIGQGNVQMKCRNCGGEAFTRAAGRYICACCGAVLEADTGESAHGEERKV